jgi:mandelate racemase
MQTPVRLTLRGLRLRAVQVPLSRPLETSNGTIRVAPLVLIDMQTHEGVIGHAYLFCYTPLALKPVMELLGHLGSSLEGLAASPLELDRRLQGQFRLLGTKGVVGMALAGIDMAAWDALARAMGQPLARVLGADATAVPAYNSCGLGMIGAARAATEAAELAAPGFRAIKVRLGYPDLQEDVAVVRAVRQAVGNKVRVMSDFNQSLSVAEATRRIRALDEEGLCWIEEPTLAEDYEGHAAIRRKAGTPIQMGENWWGTHEMASCLRAGACDLAMPDAMKIGGVTGWLRAAALAESVGLPVSSHLFPEVSAHLLAATPTRHWLEYVDWAAPILAQPMALREGLAWVHETPGTGVEWNEEAVARYLVS